MDKQDILIELKKQHSIYKTAANYHKSHAHRSIIKAKIEALNEMAKRLGLEIYFIL